MRKTIEEIYCDDCGKSVTHLPTYQILHIDNQDVCIVCIIHRVKHSIHISKLGKKCIKCEGKGKRKDFYGYHNDYNWEPCEFCNKTGRFKFF